MNNKKKNSQQHNQPTPSSYAKVNAYTLPLAKQQILTLVLFLGLLVLHSVFLPAAMMVLDQAILYVLWVILYLTFIIMCYDYCYITCTDPCDDLLIDSSSVPVMQMKRRQYNHKYNSTLDLDSNPYKMKYCTVCRRIVRQKSYHCMRCRRCSQNFDHHCKYLNTCIGGKNYVQFMRLLISTTFYLLNCIGQAVWIFVMVEQDETVDKATLSKWGVLVLIVLSVLLLIGVNILLCFHFYISCVRGMTTLQYIYRSTPSNQSTSQNLQRYEQRPNKSSQILAKQTL